MLSVSSTDLGGLLENQNSDTLLYRKGFSEFESQTGLGFVVLVGGRVKDSLVDGEGVVLVGHGNVKHLLGAGSDPKYHIGKPWGQSRHTEGATHERNTATKVRISAVVNPAVLASDVEQAARIRSSLSDFDEQWCVYSHVSALLSVGVAPTRLGQNGPAGAIY